MTSGKSATPKAKLRIALAGLFEEVNTFADASVGTAKITGNMSSGFQAWTDQAIIDDYRGSKTYMGGYIAALEEFADVEIVPTVFWSYSAGSTIDGKAYQKMKQDILDRLAKAMPVDNNHDEQQIRPWATGRKNWLSAGTLAAGRPAAAITSPIQSAKLNGPDPCAGQLHKKAGEGLAGRQP